MKSYLKFLSRNKLYTAIEFIGLAVSLSFVVIIGSYVIEQFEVKYENPDWRRVYTFAITSERESDFLGMTYSFTAAIKDAAPEVEISGALSPVDMIMISEGTMQASVVAADRDFFGIFPNLEFVQGGPEVLEDNGNMIASETFARKADLKVGDTWKIGEDAFTVAAIMKDWKSSFFKYTDVVLPIDGPVKAFTDPNDQFGSVYTFVRLYPGSDRAALEENAVSVSKKLYRSFGSGFLQGVRVYRADELLFGDVKGNSFDGPISQSDKRTLNLLLVAVLLLLVSAIINYINLNMALSAKRAREMATRMLIGASRSSVFGSQILESTVFTLVCLVVAMILAVWWTPGVNRLLNDPDIAIRIQLTPKYLAFAVLLVLVVGSLAGLMPALLSSHWKPIDVVRGDFRLRNKMTFSKIFIVLQNALAVFLIAFAVVMEAQYRKSLCRPIHANIENKYFLQVVSDELAPLRSSLEALPCVSRLAIAGEVPGVGAGGQYAKTVDGQDILYRVYHMSPDAFDMLAFDKIKDYNAPVLNTIWFGKAAFDATGFTDESHEITSLRERMYHCENFGGVIEDFPISLNNMVSQEGAMAVLVENVLETYPMHYGILMDISGDHDEAGRQIREVYENWKKDNLMYSEFANGFLTDFYREALQPERNNMRLMEIFMILSVLLSLLGLFAMSAYYADGKARDIAVRKVFGGTVDSEAWRSIREYMVLVGIACLIGIPASVYAAQEYLKEFIYRLEGYWWVFVLAAVVSAAAAFVSVIWQTMRASRTNPVEELKKE